MFHLMLFNIGKAWQSQHVIVHIENMLSRSHDKVLEISSKTETLGPMFSFPSKQTADY